MKTFKKILIWLLGIIVFLVVLSFFLPKTYRVERSIYIKARPMVIYNLTSNFSNWMVWVPWNKEMDSTAVFEIIGKDGKVGVIWKWTGNKLGEGAMTATEFQPGRLLRYDLEFDKGKYLSKGQIIIEERDSCLVTWIDEGDLGYNPIARYMGLMMSKMMGPDFEAGLSKLKKIAEIRDGWPFIEEVVVPEQTVIMVTDSAGPAEYTMVMEKAFTELFAYIKSGKLVQQGSPFSTYLRWDSATMFSVMNICIPVEKVEVGKGRIQVAVIPEHKGIMTVYWGSYSLMEPAYKAIEQYIRQTGKIETGGPSEIYITDPSVELDSTKWETHIVFPVK
jgi:effector-binding domain-containing protein